MIATLTVNPELYDYLVEFTVKYRVFRMRMMFKWMRLKRWFHKIKVSKCWCGTSVNQVISCSCDHAIYHTKVFISNQNQSMQSTKWFGKIGHTHLKSSRVPVENFYEILLHACLTIWAISLQRMSVMASKFPGNSIRFSFNSIFGRTLLVFWKQNLWVTGGFVLQRSSSAQSISTT